jgi:hypothetical protein
VPTRTHWITTTTARMDGVLGTDVVCEDHGRIGWVRTSLANALIAAHVQTHHVLTKGGRNDHAVGPPTPEAEDAR